MENKNVLRIEHLTKRFGGVAANNDVSLEIREREIHALCGENGAGKSTFCKMLTGVFQPDQGDIYIYDEKVDFKSPSESLKAGIGMVYQERNLVGHLTGAQNICLGNEPKHVGLVNERAIIKKAQEIKSQLGIDVPLDVPVETLGAGSQQIIEIMRAFYNNPSVLILDEPTASLGEGEIEPFLEFVINLKERIGISVIFISHKLEEVYRIADRITVITEGEVILTSPVEEITQQECINAMIRSDRIQKIEIKDKSFDDMPVVLSVDTIVFDNKEHKIPFIVRKGEAVGMYGLVGAGRTECMEAIGGIRLADKLGFTFDGEVINHTDPVSMINHGYILTPEKRANGAFRGLSLEDNICNLYIKKFSNKFGFMQFNKIREFAHYVLKKNGVKYKDVDQSITELSGGNIQKTIIGRSIELDNLKLLVLDEPTAGMDLGAKSEVYRKIRHLVEEEEKSVVFISSELDELLTVCDKICIFFEGNIVTEFQRRDFNKHDILSMAIGKRVQ